MIDDSEEPEELEGTAVVNASWAGTGLAFAAAALGVISPDTFGGVVAVVSGVLFVIGCVVFLWAFVTAVARSRYEVIGIGGLYFLADSAPKTVRFRLLFALVAQVIVAIAAAAIRPFTSVAFIVLVPIFGLGLCGLWGARYGEFPDRDVTATDPG